MKNSGIPLFIATALLTSCKEQPVEEKEPSKPNFLLIQADDLGFDDLNMHGNELVETPGLNQFAKNSLQFNHYYVNPCCAPSRASLLTGRNFLKTGVSHVHGGKDYLALDEITIAEVLKSAGYVTGMWGKWHTGKTEGYFPWQRGFDEAFKSQLYKHRNHYGWMNGEKVEFDQWADDVLVNYAIDFMKRHKDTSFFAYLPLISIHGPLDAPGELVKKYMEKDLSQNLATIYAMVENMDIHLSRLFKAVDDLGLAENTIIIFMSDNGPAVLNADLTDEDRAIRYVNELRGHKGNIWENGVKSPLFVQWKGTIEPGYCEQLIDGTDIFPTLANLAGADLSQHPFKIDGMDFSGLLLHPERSIDSKLSFNYANVGWPPSKLPWTPEGVKDEYKPITQAEKDTMNYHHQIISVRNKNYKLILNPGETKNQPELFNGIGLFDIVNDPMETNNIAKEKPDIREKLEIELKNWYNEVLREKNSYKMGEFLVGISDQDVVYCNAPIQTSPNLKNTVSSLKYWNAGDFAKYQILIKEKATYEIEFEYTLDEKAIEDQKIELQFNEGTLSTIIQAKGKSIFGEIELEEGPQIITLSIPDSKKLNEILNAAFKIYFTKR